jgi:hypothetical protein
MFPVHMCWEPEPAYYRQHITEEGHKLGRPVEKFATVRTNSLLICFFISYDYISVRSPYANYKVASYPNVLIQYTIR